MHFQNASCETPQVRGRSRAPLRTTYGAETPQIETPPTGQQSRAQSETPQLKIRSRPPSGTPQRPPSETPQVRIRSRTPSETPQRPPPETPPDHWKQVRQRWKQKKVLAETPVPEPVSVKKAKPRFKKDVLADTPFPEPVSVKKAKPRFKQGTSGRNARPQTICYKYKA